MLYTYKMYKLEYYGEPSTKVQVTRLDKEEVKAKRWYQFWKRRKPVVYEVWVCAENQSYSQKMRWFSNRPNELVSYSKKVYLCTPC